MLTVAQTTQNIWNFMVRKSSLQQIATLALIREISDSNIETRKYGPKSGVSWIIRKSWQQCLLDFEEDLTMKSHDKTSSAVLCHGTVLLLGVFWGFSKSNHQVGTLGARGFSCVVSSFNQVLKSDPLCHSCFQPLKLPYAREKKPLVPRVQSWQFVKSFWQVNVLAECGSF